MFTVVKLALKACVSIESMVRRIIFGTVNVSKKLPSWLFFYSSTRSLSEEEGGFYCLQPGSDIRDNALQVLLVAALTKVPTDH